MYAKYTSAFSGGGSLEYGAFYKAIQAILLVFETIKQMCLGDFLRFHHFSVFGILISHYVLNARPDICVLQPFKAFKEFPDSMPYVGAFTTHTEQLLVPHVAKIKASVPIITETLKGEDAAEGTGGDFSFIVYPLPKISLCYIFYEADDDFPASVTCQYSNNARLFLSVDGLADVGEYCSKTILKLVG